MASAVPKTQTLYKPAKLKSWVWAHFMRVKEDSNVAHCTVCKENLNFTGGTTSWLSKHLKRKHGILPATTVEATESDEEGETPELVQKPITAYAPQKDLDFNSKRHRDITDKILNIVIKDLRPLSIVEDIGMKEALRYFEPRYKVISRTTLTKRLSDKYESVRKCLETKVSNADAIALTTDGWSSCATEDFIAVTVHMITGWKLEAYLLVVEKFAQNHTADNLTQHLKQTVEAWFTIPDGGKLYITTDNAANIVKGNFICILQ